MSAKKLHSELRVISALFKCSGYYSLPPAVLKSQYFSHSLYLSISVLRITLHETESLLGSQQLLDYMELIQYREYRRPPMVPVLMDTPTTYCPHALLTLTLKGYNYPIPTVITVRDTHTMYS